MVKFERGIVWYVWDVWISTILGSPIDNLKWVSSLKVKHPQILLGDIVLSHGRWIWRMGNTLWDTPIKNKNIFSTLQCKLGICSYLIKWNGNYWLRTEYMLNLTAHSILFSMWLSISKHYFYVYILYIDLSISDY